MINHLNSKLDLMPNNLELESSLALQLYLIDVKEHLLDVWAELSPEEEVTLSNRIEKIEKSLKLRE
jgi:hypothetical protein